MTPNLLLAEALASDAVETPTFLAELVERPTWMADAECRAHPEVELFTVPGQSVDAAKAVCATCLVRSECLAYAIETDERHGVWGGLSPRARQALTQAPAAA